MPDFVIGRYVHAPLRRVRSWVHVLSVHATAAKKIQSWHLVAIENIWKQWATKSLLHGQTMTKGTVLKWYTMQIIIRLMLRFWRDTSQCLSSGYHVFLPHVGRLSNLAVGRCWDIGGQWMQRCGLVAVEIVRLCGRKLGHPWRQVGGVGWSGSSWQTRGNIGENYQHVYWGLS